MVQGVPRSASTCWWLVDRQDFFQVELFEFRSPLVRELRPDWRPNDIGYTTVSFWVDDLDATLDRARQTGSEPLTEPIGEPGERRVCLRDPDGVLIELMEDDPRSDDPRERPRPQLGVVARAVTLSVPDLERSRPFFDDVLACPSPRASSFTGPSTRRCGAWTARSETAPACGPTISWSSWSPTRTHPAGRGRRATGSATWAC